MSRTRRVSAVLLFVGILAWTVSPAPARDAAPLVLVVHPSVPAKTLPELIEYLKAHKEGTPYASSGTGGPQHLAGESFRTMTGTHLVHVPYKGGAPAITDVLGGQLPLVAVNALEVAPHAKAGKLRALAVMSAKRSPTLPDTPTIAESGYPGFEASVWYGVIAPAKTPPDVVAKLAAAVQKAVATSEVQGRLSATGGEATYGNPQQFAALIKSERERYEKVVREGNIKAD